MPQEILLSQYEHFPGTQTSVNDIKTTHPRPQIWVEYYQPVVSDHEEVRVHPDLVVGDEL